MRCFRCQGFDHVAAQCPTRALFIDELEPETNKPKVVEFEEEEVYESDSNLIEKFEKAKQTLRLVRLEPEKSLRVVRCVFAQPRRVRTGEGRLSFIPILGIKVSPAKLS